MTLNKGDLTVTGNDYGAHAVEVKRYSALFGDGPRIDGGPSCLATPFE